MISVGQIQEIVNQYEKHGWTLRRVLLSAATLRNLGAIELAFGETTATEAEIDAAWFSRSARDGGETWELRRLSGSPFALVEIFDADDEDDVREEACREIERQMESANGKRKLENGK